MNLNISSLDYVIVILYFIGTFYIGWKISLNTKTGDDLFLANRSLGFVPIGFSLFATNISSTALIGLSGFAYTYGLAVANYEWFASLVLIFMAIFMVPVYLKSKVTTIPEYLKYRFGVSSQKYYSAITIFLVVFLDIAGGIYGGVLVLKVFMPDANVWLCSFLLAAFAGLYTCMGGLKAVIYTDVIQAIVLILGSICLTFFVFQRFDFNWAAMTEGFDSERLSLVRPLSDPVAPWLGTLIGIPILGVWFWTTNQYSMQRVLAAKNIDQARKGALLGGALKLLPLFIMIIPAVFAIHIFPDISNPDLVFPHMVIELLPVGVTGLVLAGLAAAMMSSLDSGLNSTATLAVYDFILSSKNRYSPKQLKYLGQLVMVVIMLVSALWAPLIAEMGGIFAYFQKSLSVLAPPIVAVFLMGMFTILGHKKTSIYTLLLGHGIGIIFFLLTFYNILALHYTVIAGINFLISCLMFFIFSYIFKESNLRPELIYQSSEWRNQNALPWYRDYRFFSLLMILSVAGILILFW